MNLVFASGFLLPQQLPGIDYFRGLEAHFRGRHETLFPKVSPLGSVEKRANELADAIRQRFPSGAIHIIAHSMGGLDSRFLIGRNIHRLSDPGRIASLTTLATPHRGSPVADLLAGPRPEDARRQIYDTISQSIGLLGLNTGAIGNLTTANATSVPNAAQTHPHIRYRSYFAAGRSGTLPTSFALTLTHHYVKSVTGQENDGVVALESARYGDLQMPFWQCDHLDMVGHNLDDILNLGRSQFDHLAHFDAIVKQL